MKILAVAAYGHPQAERAARFVSLGHRGKARRGHVTWHHRAPERRIRAGRVPAPQRADLRCQKRVKVEDDSPAKRQLPIGEIQKKTCEEHYDLVLIGAERKSGGPFALSAKAYHLIKEIEPPVMVMIGDRIELKKILICSGGQAYIERAVHLTGELAGKSHLGVTILHVLAEAPAIYGDMLDEEADSQRILASNSLLGRNLRKELGELGTLGAEARVKLRHGFVSAEIVREIHEGGYDLVVTGSAPARGALRTYVMGDITSEIVNRAECAVLVVRGEAPVKEGGVWRRLRGWFARRANS